ncbi:hypothetical protein SKAU_G00386790 [Synaphobranchus kaupii]|uniref:Reverse transcriptase RNase H-like domain-containing protein n=1 Tax=Synaphobranchus kaupii TaxID=118154 RepID=A0A9Q1EAP1_SYNKA|nr:hypothetical protein SKAU_G00386790 [Synaphobranchus kaupii]
MTDFYIVKTGTPILGMDLVTALQLHFKGGQVIPETETVKVCATLCQPDTHRKQENESPIAFGCAKDFVHKVKIRPEVKPVQQKLRRLPLSVREAVSQELRNLEQHGIIERIDASEWVSPIVVTKKKSGDIRMINNAGLKLNVDKCQLRQTTLTFLGQKIGPEGLLPDDCHVAAILNAPPPTDPTTLRSFLGLSAWYSKFVPNYATVVEPMRALLRKDCPFQWNKTAQAALDRVKQLIVHSPALVLFDPSKSTIVSTDASDYGVGAVLTQLDSNGAEQTVAFASRSLSDAERKYSIVEKEALACVWAAEKWRTWLWGRRFLLRTDHQALTTLLTTKGNNRAGLRIARWSARLMEFDYDVEYRTGSLNHVADCLSRLPLPETDTACAEELESVAAILTDLYAVSEGDFQSECRACPMLTKLRVQIQKGWPSHKATLDPELQPFFSIRHELVVMNDCIVRAAAWEKVSVDIVGPFEIAPPDCRFAITMVDYYREPWKSFLRTYLMDYRATPHSTTGVSPSELLHGRRMRTKLEVIDMPVPPSDRHAMRERVLDKQRKMKEYTDAKRHAKSTDLHPGDEVRVRKPWRVKKGELKFSKPRTVVTKRGPNTYLLDDGRIWNASHLSALSELSTDSDSNETMDCNTGTDQPPSTDSDSQPRPARIRNPPGWTKDFVMDK